LKKISLLLIILILVAGCGSGGEIVEVDDIVSVNYVGRLEDGLVFDTSIQEVAENPIVTKTDTFSLKSVYTPFKFQVGAGEAISGFDEALIGMKTGEEKEVTIPPEKGYGNWNEELTAVLPRIFMVDAVETVSKNDLTKESGLTEFVVGETVPWREWRAEIVAINPESIVLKSQVTVTTINTEIGTIEIEVDTGTIKQTFTPAADATIRTQIGFGRLSIINETDFRVDYNPPLAGKTLNFKITLESIILISLSIGCLGSEPSSNLTVTPPATEIIPGASPEVGDVVQINYIIKAEGEIIDTTYEDSAIASHYAGLIESLHPFGFEPFTFIAHTDYANPYLRILSKTVLDMGAGEEKTISLNSRDFGWEKGDDLTQSQPRFFSIPREETLSIASFQEIFGMEPEEGMEVSRYKHWNSTVTKVTDGVAHLLHNPVKGSTFEGPGGTIKISFDDSIVTTELVPKINQPFLTPDDRFVTYTAVNETLITVDYSHPFAAKILDVEIALLSVSEPIHWNTDLQKAISQADENGTPVFLLFTAIGCNDCKRIEQEVTLDPLLLTLKDEFIWVKIDPAKEVEIAEKYSASELPLVIILKDGIEKTRITTYLPPKAMRAEMESALETS
jgi:FKBP-type peptidyl-prolyl cis-trans isomerase 2